MRVTREIEITIDLELLDDEAFVSSAGSEFQIQYNDKYIHIGLDQLPLFIEALTIIQDEINKENT